MNHVLIGFLIRNLGIQNNCLAKSINSDPDLIKQFEINQKEFNIYGKWSKQIDWQSQFISTFSIKFDFLDHLIHIKVIIFDCLIQNRSKSIDFNQKLVDFNQKLTLSFNRNAILSLDFWIKTKSTFEFGQLEIRTVNDSILRP